MPDSLAVTGRLLQEALPFLMFAGIFLGFIAIGIVAMVLRHKEKERLHKERLFLMEQGKEIPEILYGKKEKKEKKPSDYRTTRIWLLAIGVFFILIGVVMTIVITITEGTQEGLPGLSCVGMGGALVLIERIIYRMFVKKNGSGTAV
ncbi:MAG: hypothetical protein JW958_07740 [Candidatus Eisenbacteria bacterium]|nr:hypothetical protein [Candidatus Eisenbacteria bacterium]